MKGLQALLEIAVSEAQVPFVVASVADRNGVSYEGAAGDAGYYRKADNRTIFRIFSMTKAIGSTMAAIMIERGKLSLDTPVAAVLPEWDDLSVCESMQAGKPVLRRPRTQATLRHLATHTSGLEYEFWNSDVAAYMAATGHPSVLSGTLESMKYPLMTDPGTRWGYGPNIDWLCRMVAAADGRSIDRFCQEEILMPLGMFSTRFELLPDDAAQLANVHIRAADRKFLPVDINPPTNPEFYGMGHALYSTIRDYMRFCRMILNAGTLNGVRILGPEGISLLSNDQMGGPRFTKMVSSSLLTEDVDMFPGLPVGHTLGFLQNQADVPGQRRSGSLTWAGVLNTHFWIDPKAGLTAVIMTQSLPFADTPLMKFYRDFERVVYAA